ncbi:MAG: chemoreceptor glutamine deamidase CheD [Pseudomonadota bacterium]
MSSEKLPPLPKPLKGFSDVNRYWDKYHGKYAAKLLPGQCYVTVNDEIIVTVLGSCISACIRDTVFGIGGMNHFMLPVSRKNSQSDNWLSEANRYGNFAMENLINEILKNGGDRRNIEVKLFGGGRVISHITSADVGRKNIDFVLSYVKMEGFAVKAQDLGAFYPRKVVYFPLTGRVKVKKLVSMHNDTIIQREAEYLESLQTKPIQGDVELF